MRSWLIPLLIAGSLVAGLSACTDTEPPPAVDDLGPEVAVLYPDENFDALHRVQDETLIYVGATDPSGVSRVTVYFQRPADTQRTEIATVTQPTSLAQVPDTLLDDIQLPQGWELYEVFWSSQEVRSGLEPQIFAEAFDTHENRTVSPSVTVEVINTTDLEPPVADFIISPQSGSTDTFFSFDPRITTDRVENNSILRVRWDFDGDGIWDLGDWDDPGEAPVFANHTQTWQYFRPNPYSVRMQAKNSYFPGASEVQVRLLSVTGRGGAPHPPSTMVGQFALVPSGTYTQGAANPVGASLDELPVHRVTLTSDYYILNREVSNAEYLEYLNSAIDSLRIVFLNDQIFSTDSTGYRLMALNNSRIFFNIDDNGYRIEPGYEDHPVVGATWHGANDFAVFYGLRLPTEAEWEVAARGDSLYYRYSYGRNLDDGDPTRTRRINYENSGDPFEGDRGTTPTKYYDGSNHAGFETVDTGYEVPGTGMKIYDMSGNASEWVNDWYGPYGGDQTNPQGPPFAGEFGNFKVVRGGSYLNSAGGCRVTAREGDRTPEDSFPSIGFRVAYFPTANPGRSGIFGR